MNDPVASRSGRLGPWGPISSEKSRNPSTAPPTAKRLASGVTQSSVARAASAAKRACTTRALVSASLTM